MVESKNKSELGKCNTNSVKPSDSVDDGPIISVQAQGAQLEEPQVKKPTGAKRAKEINGPKGLEPTRYGDWESKGRCHDF